MVWISIMAKLGLASNCSCSSLVLLSLLSQSEDSVNLPRQSLPNNVYMTQYLESSAAFVEAVGEVSEVGMEYCLLIEFLAWGQVCQHAACHIYGFLGEASVDFQFI